MEYKKLDKIFILNWLNNFNEIIKENNNISYNIDDYKNLSLDEIRNVRNLIGKNIQILKNKIKDLTLPIEGISEKDSTCFLQMPEEILNHVKSWDVIRKSPYSCSLYSDNNISWDFKPDGCYSVSDHWNFFTRGKYHKITDKMVINNTHITLCRFNSNIKPSEGYLIKKRIFQGNFTKDEIENMQKNDEVWEVILSLPKNKIKIKQINKIRNEINLNKSLLNKLRDLSENDLNHIKNYNNFTQEIIEKKSEDGNIKIFNKQKNSVISQNKEYNFKPIPAKFKDKDPNYDIVISKKIEIGDKTPVCKFREWQSQFWKKKSELKKSKK